MPGTNLTLDEATTRAASLSVSSYDVVLDLTTGDRTFDTSTTVRFNSTTPGAESFIDFIGDEVRSITLNGQRLDPAAHWHDSRISLPGLATDNELVVEATGLYTNTGEGMHRFVDPVDEEVYLYSQFEVPDSRRVYAVFEQPDLKATFAFTLTVPEHWTVLSNQPSPEPTEAEERNGIRTRTWAFEPTPRMSSYITALVAGPYVGVHDEVATRNGSLPLGIYARKSLIEHVDAENIFDVTKRGFTFFEEEFDCAYPFAKYDQVFTPEYNAGAMENAGLVTITEIYVFRSKVTDTIVERRALTILHEIAHMWFGDLVTMTWWDDLWLNESFAEWASTVAQSEATQWTDAWTTFQSHEKTWAYQQDQLPSTHPVYADIQDLEDVLINFDGITYAKGGSILKQLVAYVGREAFVDGLRSYFRKYAWGNTRFADLLAEFEASSGRDLSTWSQVWLKTAGVNTIEIEVETDEQDVITAATVVQTATTAYPTLRPHRLAVGRYDLRDGRLVRTGRHELDLVGERTEVTELVGLPRPDLLLANDDDLTYAKLRFDERSLATALAHAPAFAESLPRSLVLGAFWEMVRDGDLAARDFIPLLLDCAEVEHHSTVLRTILTTTKQIPAQLGTAAAAYCAPQHRAATLRVVAERLGAMAESAEPGTDRQFQLVGAFAKVAHSEADVARIRAAFDGSQPYPGLEVDQDLRWHLLTSLAAAGAAGAAEIDAELERDNTTNGREHAFLAMAARPTAEAKAEAWRLAVEEEGQPNSVVVALGNGFNRAHDPQALLSDYVAKWHDALVPIWQTRSAAIRERFVKYFYPSASSGRSSRPPRSSGWTRTRTPPPRCGGSSASTWTRSGPASGRRR